MAKTVDKMVLEIIADNKDAIKKIIQVEKTTKKSMDKTKGLFNGLKKNWLAIAGIMALAVVGLKKAFDFTKEFNEYKQGMDALARNTGRNADDIVAKLREVTKGTVSNKDIMLSANRLVALNVTKDTKKMADLFEIARLKAKAMGITTSQAVNDIATGIGRQSPLILDNLGIITKGWAEEAKSAGVAMDQQFILNKILAEGREELKKTGATALTGAERYQTMESSIANLRIASGQLINKALKPLIIWVTKAVQKITGFIDVLNKEADAKRRLLDIDKETVRRLKNQGVAFQGNAEKVRKLVDAYKKWDEEEEVIAKSGLANHMIDMASSMGIITNETEDGRIALKNFIDTYLKSVEAIDEAIDKLKNKEDSVTPKEPPVLVPESTVEESKGRIEDFYEFLNMQAELERMNEIERRDLALLGLLELLEQKKINIMEYNAGIEALEEQHAENMANINTGLTKFLVDNWRKALDQVGDEWGTTIAETLIEGKKFEKNFSDLILDIVKSFAKLIIKMLVVKSLQTVLGGGTGLFSSIIPGLAKGTKSHKGGLAVVGEKGSELVNLPKGSQVIPHNKISSRFNTIPKYADGIGDTNAIDQSRKVSIENLTVQTEDAGNFLDQLEELSENVNSPLFQRN